MDALSLPLLTVLREAQREASDLGEEFVSTEHLLLGLTAVPVSTASELLYTMQITQSSLRELVQRSPCSAKRSPPTIQLTPRGRRVIQLASELSTAAGCATVGTHHLLSALLSEGEGLAAIVLRKAGLNAETLKNDVLKMPSE